MRYLLLFALVACGGGIRYVPPGPPVPPHADAVTQCAAICDRLVLLQCEGRDGNIGPDEVPGTSDDATCQTACVAVQSVVALNTDCIVAAPNCDVVSNCEAE